MHVIATAGHVDHGKSTLVRALTGAEPDRLEEERRRGLSIELGYAWTDLDGVGEVAFVDVPGHQRFVSTMLAGIGPVPAVLFVVAADDPWMPQAAEHLAALDALDVRHGVVAVTRTDLAEPEPAVGRARAALASTSLRDAPVVPVSAVTGAGLDELRAGLATMVRALPEPAPDAPVRLWVDRRFTMRGAGTVVTATLPAGTVRPGDGLSTGAATVRVRAVQSLGRPVESATGPARVALNLASGAADQVDRGGVLVTPGAWWPSELVDVRVRAAAGGRDLPPERPMLHIGAGSLAVHARPLAGDVVRLRLGRPLPLHVGDRALLRDPGSRQVWGVTVLDPAPPPLDRRGAARRRTRALHEHPPGLLAAEIDRRGVVPAELLRQIGVPVDDTAPDAGGAVVADGWLMSAVRAEEAARALPDVVLEHEAATPLVAGLPVHVLAERLGLPSAQLVPAVVRPPFRVESGRVSSGQAGALPQWLREAVRTVCAELTGTPFAAPVADRLRELGLDDRSAAAAARAGLLLRPAPGVLLAPGTDLLAARLLAELAQPFSTGEARAHLGTSRRVVLPLLDHLDRSGLTRRHPDDRREVTGRG